MYIVWMKEQSDPVVDLTKDDKGGGMPANIVELNRFIPKAQSWITQDANVVMTQNAIVQMKALI